MVKNLSAQNASQYGTINKIGLTNDGRAIYQLTGADGYQAGKISIPEKDCDTFEKSYSDIIEIAPKLEKYAKENSSPEKIEKKNKIAKWTLGLSTLTGFAIPAITTGKLKRWHQWVLTIGGTAIGFICGRLINYAANTPPGMNQFKQAADTMSKIDIQPVMDDNKPAKFV